MTIAAIHPYFAGEWEFIPMARKAKLGSGKRFAALKGKLAKRGARNPGALAAWIGRKKYGKRGFARLSRKGRR